MRRKKRPQRPICGCEHDLAFHEPDGDGGGTICRFISMEHSGSDHRGNWTYERIQCPCQQYTGPRIMDPGYVARAMTLDLQEPS